MRMILSIFVFLPFVAGSLACSCREMTLKDAYCAANWVGRVKILSRDPHFPTPLNSVTYGVKFVEIFKAPVSNASLPSEIHTPKLETCGIVLDVEKEYLLAGTIQNGTLITSDCGQIFRNNPDISSAGAARSWNTVPQTLQTQLQTRALEPCNKKA